MRSCIELPKGQLLIALQIPNASKASEQQATHLALTHGFLPHTLFCLRQTPTPCNHAIVIRKQKKRVWRVSYQLCHGHPELQATSIPHASQPRIDPDCLGLPLERSRVPRSPPPNPAPSNHSDSLAAVAVASDRTPFKESHQNYAKLSKTPRFICW